MIGSSKASLRLVLLAAVLLAITSAACGGTKSGSPGSRPVTAIAGAVDGKETASTSSTKGYLNDGDAEKVNDHDMDNKSINHEDGDADSLEEYEPTVDNNQYHDSDDAGILAWGHAGNTTDVQAIAATVQRYYAFAVKEDGAGACSMIVPSIARAIPEDYGRGSAGPPYLRGGKSCQAVMVLLFKHSHAHLTTAVAVTGVRINGDEAHTLLGSRRMPADILAVRREHGTWKIDGLLGGPLP